MNSKLVLLFLLPILGLTSNCTFTSPAPYNISCSQLNQNGYCNQCNNGYYFLQGNCYPPCPSGYDQLMPGYCFNSTVINDQQNFTLCPTNSTSVVGNACLTPPGSTCKCAPACPQGYQGIACTCNFVGSEVEQDAQINSSWLPTFLFVLGMISLLMLTSYIAYLSMKKKEKMAQSLKQVEAPKYERMVSQN